MECKIVKLGPMARLRKFSGFCFKGCCEYTAEEWDRAINNATGNETVENFWSMWRNPQHCSSCGNGGAKGADGVHCKICEASE